MIFIISSVVNLTSNATTAIADGKSAILFTATVKDNLGNLTPNVIVTFFNESGTSLSQSTATTNANGQATVSLTSSTVGSFPLTAKVDNNPADNGISTTVSFIADIATAVVADIKPGSRTAVAGVDTVMVTATVKDKFGHLVQNADVTFTTSLGSINPPTATTDANGQASVSLQSGTVGDAIVTAAVSSNANDKGRRKMVTFVEDIDRPIPKPE
ncbi:hypothetical protein IW01_14170 [Pectobacterium brasiliense]|nr:hypothetical protein IW01_14170 [Pectobacterium brasiliense]